MDVDRLYLDKIEVVAMFDSDAQAIECAHELLIKDVIVFSFIRRSSFFFKGVWKESYALILLTSQEHVVLIRDILASLGGHIEKKTTSRDAEIVYVSSLGDKKKAGV